jgi:hypothetical protein
VLVQPFLRVRARKENYIQGPLTVQSCPSDGGIGAVCGRQLMLGCCSEAIASLGTSVARGCCAKHAGKAKGASECKSDERLVDPLWVTQDKVKSRGCGGAAPPLLLPTLAWKTVRRRKQGGWTSAAATRGATSRHGIEALGGSSALRSSCPDGSSSSGTGAVPMPSLGTAPPGRWSPFPCTPTAPAGNNGRMGRTIGSRH